MNVFKVGAHELLFVTGQNKIILDRAKLQKCLSSDSSRVNMIRQYFVNIVREA